jgi:hypothetical protein
MGADRLRLTLANIPGEPRAIGYHERAVAGAGVELLEHDPEKWRPFSEKMII